MAVAGWYPDEGGTLRYWDGEQWTEHVQPLEVDETVTATEVMAVADSAAGSEFMYDAAQASLASAGGTQIVASKATLQSPVGQIPLQEQPASTQMGTQIYVGGAGPAKPTNGIGVAGFVLALIGVFLAWVPFLGWVVWLLGLIFSAVGVFKTPKGLSIAGLVISLLDLILLLVVLGGLMTALSLS